MSQSIKIDKETWARLKRCAAAGGYSSPEELVNHLLSKELSKFEDTDSEEEIVRKLQGLGYLD